MLVAFLERGETHTTIAHDTSRYAVQDTGGQRLIPGDLPVKVRMYVNKSRRHDRAVRVNGCLCSPNIATDGHDHGIADTDIRRHRLATVSVVNQGAAYFCVNQDLYLSRLARQ